MSRHDPTGLAGGWWQSWDLSSRSWREKFTAHTKSDTSARNSNLSNSKTVPNGTQESDMAELIEGKNPSSQGYSAAMEQYMLNTVAASGAVVQSSTQNYVVTMDALNKSFVTSMEGMNKLYSQYVGNQLGMEMVAGNIDNSTRNVNGGAEQESEADTEQNTEGTSSQGG